MILLALMPCLPSSTVKASVDDPPEGIPIGLEGLPPLHPRSIAPKCYYEDGYVYVIAESSVTSISGTLTRLSDNAQWSDSSTGCMLQIAVPTDPATYRLTLTLSDGSAYYGDYTLF